MTEEINNISIYRPPDVYDKMKYNFSVGKVKGSTTYNATVDNAWKWRKRESNIWTGYANEGKSLLLKQFCMIKALEENWRFAFSSPEDFPPEDFYDDMIHTLVGLPTDRDNPYVMNQEFYDLAYNLIKEHFVFVYIKPPNNTIKGVLTEFKKLCDSEQIDGVVVDPLLKFAWPRDFPDNYERYASYIGSLFVDFCRETNTSAHLVMHQVTPLFEDTKDKDGEKVKRYAEPSMYRVKGGGSWADGFDNILSVWRPAYAYDKIDTKVQFASQKIKKQKLVGIPQRIELDFNRRTNRYIDTQYETPLFDFDKFIYDTNS